jgi:hypothetical protein
VFNDLSNEYNIVMTEIQKLTVAYNPNDFYYYNAKFTDGTNVRTNSSYNDNNTCSTFMSSNIDCKNDLNKCFDKELCKNRKNAMKIRKLQTNHDGADIRNIDTTVDYNRELLKSYNLAIGSLGILAIFYFLYK